VTKHPERLALLAAILLAVGVTTAVYAATMGREQQLESKAYVEGFRPDHRETLYLDDADGTDSVTDVGTTTVGGASGVDSRKQIYCKGYARVAISGEFSASGATCAIFVSRLNKGSTNWTFRSGVAGTLTANAGVPLADTLYPSTGSIAVSTHGAEWIVVTYADPSSGTCDITAEVY